MAHCGANGVGRATLAGLAAGAAGAAVGVAVSLAVPVSHKLMYAMVGAAASACAVMVFIAVAYFLDDGDLRMVAAKVRRISAERRLGLRTPFRFNWLARWLP